MTDVYHLYAIRLPVNDYAIAYIGVTKRPHGRWADHAKGREFIGRAVRECGRQNVIFEILVTGSRELIYRREIDAIVAENTRWPNGYNLATGGFGCRNPLPETREKLRQANQGKKQSAAHIEHMAATKRGVSHSAEHVAKVAAANTGKRRTPEVRATRGPKNPRRWTREERNQMSRRRRDIPKSPGHKAAIGAGQQRAWQLRRSMGAVP